MRREVGMEDVRRMGLGGISIGEEMGMEILKIRGEWE